MGSVATKLQKKSKSEDRLSSPAPKAITKTADPKGRVALGGDFANRAVIVERLSDTEVLVKLARVIPESEAWIYENAEALGSVRRGLAQARARQAGQGPDLEADSRLAAELED